MTRLPLLNRSFSSLAVLLKHNKRIQHLSRLGRIAEARQVFDSMPQRDAVSWNTLISAYSRNNLIHEARSLFDAFQAKNIRTWTIMLSAYANTGNMTEAIGILESMPEKNVVSYNALLTGFLVNGDFVRGRRLFDEMQEKNVVSYNAMMGGYFKAGRVEKAEELFDEMPVRNEVSYTVMISGYVEVNECGKGWDVFRIMHRRGEVEPDQKIILAALETIVGLEDVVLVDNLMTLAMKLGYCEDLVVGTAFLNSYIRNEWLDFAVKFFEGMPDKNEYTWTTLISSLGKCGRLKDAVEVYECVPEQTAATRTAMMTVYAQNGRILDATRVFDEIKNPNVVAWNAMLTGYAQNGMVDEVNDLFLQMPVRNLASWSAMISGLVQNGQNEKALEVLAELHSSGSIPSDFSITSVLLACANTGNLEAGRQMHSLSIKSGCQFNSYIGNSLIHMYGKCSDDAVSTFLKMPKRDAMSWTAVISASVQAGQDEIALHLFCEMLSHGIKPRAQTVTSILSACGSMGATKLGEQFHALISKTGLSSCLYVGNALITMYFRCGSEDGGLRVFKEMGEQDIVSWNAVLTGCAHSGLGKKAIQIFKKMTSEGVAPNQISFLGLLGACSYAGLVMEGLAYFSSMRQDYGIEPSIGHYTVIVNLLGRVGRLYEAKTLIENMPMEPDTVIWEALLAACKIHCDFELGIRVAEELLQIGTQDPGAYLLLSNLYASQGRWEKVSEVQKLRQNREVNKEPAFSRICIQNKLHCFFAGDRTHDQINEIGSAIMEFHKRFQAAGYVPNTNFVLHDLEEDQKEEELLYHSEKIAVVFGILNTPNASPIQITRNLHICGDCHTFMKFMSKETERKITIRDRSRFHHFHDGLCSCGDYW